jgi:hypothetical protein
MCILVIGAHMRGSDAAGFYIRERLGSSIHLLGYHSTAQTRLGRASL